MLKTPWAIRSSFFLNGLGVGALYSTLPDFKEKLNIDNAPIGTALLIGGFGVLLSVQITGRIVAKYGSKPVAFYGALVNAAVIATFGLISNWVQLVLGFFAFGFASAMQDIAMNTHATTLEHETSRRFMSGFHAIFSLGALAGSFYGGLASQLEIKIVTRTILIALVFLITTYAFRNWWLEAHLDQHPIHKEHRIKPPFIFIFIGLLGLAGAVNEGAAGDWGGILARETFNATPFLASLPYILFNAGMVFGRLNGDWLADKFGPYRILFSAGLIAGIGLATGLIIGGIGGQIFGWISIGLGMSVVIPMVFSLAGEKARSSYAGKVAPSQAVALASGVSYIGFLGGPPMMGYLSDAITLRWAMLIPAALSIALAITSQSLKRS